MSRELGTLSNDSLKKQTFLKTLFFCTFKVDVFLKHIALSSLPYGRVQRERKLCCLLGSFCPEYSWSMVAAAAPDWISSGAVCPSLGPILLGFSNGGTKLEQCSQTPVKVPALPLSALGTSILNFPTVGRRGTITLEPGCRVARHRPRLLHRHTPWQQWKHTAPDPRPLLASTIALYSPRAHHTVHLKSLPC